VRGTLLSPGRVLFLDMSHGVQLCSACGQRRPHVLIHVNVPIVTFNASFFCIQGVAFCWSAGRVLFMDLSRGMQPVLAARMWAAAAAVWRNPSVGKAGFRLQEQIAALLQHGVEVSPCSLLRVEEHLPIARGEIGCTWRNWLHAPSFASYRRAW